MLAACMKCFDTIVETHYTMNCLFLVYRHNDINIPVINKTFHFHYLFVQVTATDGDKDRPQNIVYFLTGQGIDPDNPANSKFDINRTTGEIFVLKVIYIIYIKHYIHVFH